MKIGPHQLENSVILAPMAGVTDLPFRKLCMANGAAAAVSEMIAANPKLWNTHKSLKRLDHGDEAGLRWIQIAGSEAEQMAQAAKHNAQLGADIIDINMGCPAKKVCNKAAGSALLSNPEMVREILHAVVDAVQIPVTLKIRTGSDVESRNALEIAEIAENAGIQALSIHGRTRADRFKGEAEYETIAQVKSAVSIPVIANGDINSVSKAKKILDFTGVDGIMVGRAAQGRPWIFKQINHFLKTATMLAPPSLEIIIDTLLTHVQQLHQFYGDYMGVKIARKHVGWYLSNFEDDLNFTKQLRKRFNQIEQPLLQLNWIEQLTQLISSKTLTTTEIQHKHKFYQSIELAKVS